MAQINVDAKGALVIANEPARALFNLSHDDIGRPLDDLDFAYRAVELRMPMEDAFKTKRPVSVRDVELSAAGAPPRYFDLTVIPLYDPTGSRLGDKAVFAGVTRFKQTEEELEQSQQELETASQELQSPNEELETTNEELRLTNEALETMNEELQSTNAHLAASNKELGQRSEELAELNRFSHMVLIQAQEAIIAVDPDMEIAAWNHRSEGPWGLRRDEVSG